MTQNKQFYVQVCRSEDHHVVESIGPMPRWKATKVEGGLNINLNHKIYYTQIVPAVGQGEST